MWVIHQFQKRSETRHCQPSTFPRAFLRCFHKLFAMFSCPISFVVSSSLFRSLFLSNFLSLPLSCSQSLVLFLPPLSSPIIVFLSYSFLVPSSFTLLLCSFSFSLLFCHSLLVRFFSAASSLMFPFFLSSSLFLFPVFFCLSLGASVRRRWSGELQEELLQVQKGGRRVWLWGYRATQGVS